MSNEQEGRVRERFEREVTEHEMTVRHDDGLYRHLRFQRPGTYSYGFDLVTWPGYLAIVGDCGDYVFSRIPDMFEFFEQGHGEINPGYWAEKLQGPGHDTARRFSPARFRRRLVEWADAVVEARGLSADEERELRAALSDQVIQGEYGEPDESEAHRRLRDFEHNGLYLADSWEWDLREYDSHFLWCCHAIVWGIARYRTAAASESVAA